MPQGDGGEWRGDPGPVTFRERVLLAVLFIATAILIFLAYQLARPFLPALAWALALAIVSYPLYRRLQGLIRSQSLASALAVVLVALVVVAPAIFVGHQIANQLASTLDTFKSGAVEEKVRKAIERNPTATRLYRWGEQNLNMSEAVNRTATAIGQQLTGILTGSVAGIMGLIITFFFLFYFLRDCNEGLTKIQSVLPLSTEESNALFERLYDTIQATVFGTLAVAAVQGTLGGLMFWWLGLPGPLLWGLVMALLAVVPVLGAFVIWIPAATYLAIEGHWGKALLLTAWGLVVIGFIDNLLYPVLVGKKLRLHTVPVFIAIVGGLLLFGASGVILGPVILALNMGVVEVWRTRARQGKLAQVQRT